jgi:hypothetical protein
MFITLLKTNHPDPDDLEALRMICLNRSNIFYPANIE